VFSALEIGVSFGGVVAVDGVSFEVADREIVGLAGPNGSGKTTALNALTGLVQCEGTASLDGRNLPLTRPRLMRKAGILRMFQAPQIYVNLSVLDNVMLSSPQTRGTGVVDAFLRRRRMRLTEAVRRSTALEVLRTCELDWAADQSAGMLPYGQRRLLDLARAVAGEPRVLLLDEPTAGLNERETSEVARSLEALRDRGVSLLIVDHKVELLSHLCSRLLFLDNGKVVAQGPPNEVWNDPRVAAAYLGTRRDA
jgi:branched-chain amino acid transport system ATP-binding protein